MIVFNIDYLGIPVVLSIDSDDKDVPADYKIETPIEGATPERMKDKKFRDALTFLEDEFRAALIDGVGLSTKMGKTGSTPLDTFIRLSKMQADQEITSFEVIEGESILDGGHDDHPEYLQLGDPGPIPDWITEAIANG